MIIIHGMDKLQESAYLPRYVGKKLAEHLRVMPAVVLTGARQTGKSTLVRRTAGKRRTYYTLDDLDVVDVARTDPNALVDTDSRITLDEVQREPDLLLAVKRAVDKSRTPGRFLLTGSANLLLMKRVSESLAGRASYLTLRPLTRREQLGQATCGLWGQLLDTPEKNWIELLADTKSDEEDWRDLARRGGYPTPAVQMTGHAQRAIWFDGYVRTYVERDLQDLSSISALPEFRRLMQAAAYRVGQLVNQTELGRDVSLPQSTVFRYLNLLETSYILSRLPAFSVNRTKRLIKSSKIYWGDTGLACHLSGLSKPAGAHLENIILHDLNVWADGNGLSANVYYWRTAGGDEVDLVVDNGGMLLPIEVKSSGQPRVRDARHLLTFQQEYGSDSRAGLLLHTGTTLRWITPRVLAAPWWRVV